MAHHQKHADTEEQLPLRLRREPKPGDNPLKRPYPQHARDIDLLAGFLSEITKEPENYNFSKRDLRLPIRPHGVLFIHVLELHDIILSISNFVLDSPYCVYVELECQDMARCSDPVYSNTTKKVRIDHSVNMCIKLSDIRSDEKNDFLLHVYAFQDPETHYLIGSQVIHIYEFVRELHGITTVTIINDLYFKVGTITFEYAWAYGSFGYGFSNQLRNPQNPVLENISHSMFPRIALSPDDLVDNHVHARIPKKLRLITLHSLLVHAPSKKKSGEDTRKATLQTKKLSRRKSAKDYEAKPVVFRQVKFARGRPVHVSLNVDIHQKFMEEDFNQSYGEFLCLRTRKDRLSWLARLIEGRLRDRVEFDVPELFSPYEDVDDARRALTLNRPLACPPGFLEHNPVPKGPCHPLGPIKSSHEDVKFMHEKLASAPRFSGYLAYVFGYEKPPPKDPKLEGFEYVLDKKAHQAEGQAIIDHRTCLQLVAKSFQIWAIHVKIWFMSAFDFLFPAFDKGQEDILPEISVTLPSPSHSTSDFHALCTQFQVFETETDLAQTKRKAKSYLQMTRKPYENEGGGNKNATGDGDDDTESYTIPTQAFVGENNVGRSRGVLGHAEQTNVHVHKKREN